MQVVVEEVGDGGLLCKVRSKDEDAFDGWVRTRNLSRLQRSSGLADLEQLAQLAVEQLSQREAQVYTQGLTLSQHALLLALAACPSR